jgi:Common central domain of tyrosinase/Polyphenol oxidase middle domain
MTYPPQEPRVRQDIRDLGTDADPWDPIVLAYAEAVRTMQSRPLEDPTGWEYQAAMHGRAGSPLPGALWNECQHATWYFLPWHRMYLYHFEALVRRAVSANGGPDDWALPYWNYSPDPDAARLPAAFRERTLPSGSANPLFVEQRNPRRNAGVPLPPQVTDTTRALAPTIFTNPPPPAPAAFGGPRTGFAHQGPAFGTLEATPHGAVHVQVGGWMSDPDTAALDPIFWLHHANIDRLWEVWLRQGDRENPAASQWLTQRFDLHDADGQRVTMTVNEVLDSSSQLGYTYSNLPAPPAVPVAGQAQVVGSSAMSDQPPPQLVGATERPVVLTGSAASTEVSLSAPTGPMAEGFAAGRPRRAYMHIENITGDRNPGTSYGVYVNLPSEDLPAEERDAHLVGVVSFFGIKQANDPDAGLREQHGLHYAFDVTDVLDRVGPREAGEGELRVTFLPLEPPGGEEAFATHPEVSIGTVSLFYGQ